MISKTENPESLTKAQLLKRISEREEILFNLIRSK